MKDSKTSSSVYQVSILRLSIGWQVSWSLLMGYREAGRYIQNRWSGPWACGYVNAWNWQYFGTADSLRGVNGTCSHSLDVKVHPSLRRWRINGRFSANGDNPARGEVMKLWGEVGCLGAAKRLRFFIEDGSWAASPWGIGISYDNKKRG